MARTVKLAPTENSELKAKQVVAPSRFSGIRNNLPAIFGAAALVAAGALAGTALAHGGPEGRDGRHPGSGMEARMEMHRGGDGQRATGKPSLRGGLSGTVASVTATDLSITLTDSTTKSIPLDVATRYFTQTAGTSADVTVGSYVLVDGGMPAGRAVVTAKNIAVLTSGRTDVRLHLGHPAKVSAVNGSQITLEVATPRGVKKATVTIGANTTISKITTASSADLTAGSNVVVELGRNMGAAQSVLIIK